MTIGSLTRISQAMQNTLDGLFAIVELSLQAAVILNDDVHCTRLIVPRFPNPSTSPTVASATLVVLPYRSLM